jgi:hypothetical protein
MKIYFLLIFFLLKNFVFAQVNDDFQVLNRLIEKSLIPVQDFFIADSIKSAKVQVYSSEPKLNDLIRFHLLKNIDEEPNSIYSIEILVNKYEVVLPEVVSYPLFGEEKIQRKSSLDVSYLISKNGVKIKNFNFSETITDTLTISQISDEISPKSLKLPQVPFYRKIIEPAVISIATGIIVYLFFITRSK